MQDNPLNNPFVNNVERLPLDVTRAYGSQVFDENTQRMYYDLWGDEGVASMGYGATFRHALLRFLDSGHPHRLPDMYPSPLRTRAADVLRERMGGDAGPYAKVFFCNSGAEVNEAAIKAARRYWAEVRKQPHRHVIVTLEGNFHGRSGFALAASDSTDSPYHKVGFGPMAPGFAVITEQEVIQAAREAEARGGVLKPSTTPRMNLAPFLDNQKAPPVAWEHVAALHFAPILGNNVVKRYSPEFWRAVNTLRDRLGILLSYDDVQMANGRTGYYASWQHPDIAVRPDLLSIGKGLALGLPAAALLLTEETQKAFSPGVHFATFGGTLLCCWMMTELMAWLDNNLPTIREHDDTIRNYFASRDWVESFDGAGVHWGFKPKGERFDGFAFSRIARNHGLLLVTHRQHGIIRFTPPLTITNGELQDIFAALDATAQEAAAEHIATPMGPPTTTLPDIDPAHGGTALKGHIADERGALKDTGD